MVAYSIHPLSSHQESKIAGMFRFLLFFVRALGLSLEEESVGCFRAIESSFCNIHFSIIRLTA